MKADDSLDFNVGHSVFESGVTFHPPESVAESNAFSKHDNSFRSPPTLDNALTKRLSLGNFVEFTDLKKIKKRKPRNNPIALILVCCLVMGCIVVPAGVLYSILNEDEEAASNESPREISSQNPTLTPTQSPTDNFEFSFQRRRNIERLCGPNMDPSYAINGRFFTSCANHRAMLCRQDSTDPTLGILEEVSCLDSGRFCLCPELLLFTPFENEISASQLCGEAGAEVPRECSVLRESIDFIGNRVELTSEGVFSQMADFCSSPEGEDVQICLHDALRVECRNIFGPSDFEVRECRTNIGDLCDCGVDNFVFGRGRNGASICFNFIDFSSRCE